jgi:asparagine synthase (glutamine-hydrolysing)
MCGIAGIVSMGGHFAGPELLAIAAAMGDTLAHRGPDDAGAWLDPTGTCALAHRRLSILDLSERGRQPMLTPDGLVGLTFNGEIYDERLLRADLRARGYPFRSESDAESLLYLFASGEPRNLPRLSGMYAFATWNAATRRLFLARDPFGKKPLLVAASEGWAQGRGWLAFASELRAFRAIPGFRAAVDPAAVAEYLLLQYVPAPRTIWRRCEKLPPGSWLALECGDEVPRRSEGRHAAWRPRGAHVAATPYARTPPATLERAADALLPVLLGAVERRLRSDVPLGAFLSGGIDSALVCAMVTRELGRPLHSFSIGFRGSPESEHELARQAADALGTEHHEQLLEPSALELLPCIAAALDEPLGDSSCLPTWLLARFTRQHVTVTLSGDGGDELFGGYGRYRETLDEEADWKRRALFLLRQRRAWTAGEAYCGPRWFMLSPEQVGALTGPAGLAHARGLFLRWAARIDGDGRPLIDRLREIDADTYMPGAVLAKVDRMSMAFALEVRCPLLDAEVARHAESLPAELAWQQGLSKPVLRTLAARYLPREHCARGKLGFGLPGGAWTSAEVLALCDELLLSPGSRCGDLLDREGLRRFVAHQRQPGCFSIFQTWNLLVLEAWLRAQAALPAPPPHAGRLQNAAPRGDGPALAGASANAAAGSA